MGKGDRAVGDLDSGGAFLVQLADGFDDFCHPAPVGRTVAAQAPAVCVEGESSVWRDERPSQARTAPRRLSRNPRSSRVSITVMVNEL